MSLSGSFILKQSVLSSVIALLLTGFSPSSVHAVNQEFATGNVIAAGGSHTCLIRDDANVSCWGSNNAQQANSPGAQVTQISAGYEHNCAITIDSTAICWGNSREDRLAVPANLGKVSQISAGEIHSCALTTLGLVKCWGAKRFLGTANPVQIPNFSGKAIGVAAGKFHSCLIKEAGEVLCWGRDTASAVPSDLGPVKQIAAGGDSTCVVTANNSVRCWGNFSNVPVDLGQVVQVSVGNNYACALNSQRKSKCWGSITLEQNPTNGDVSHPLENVTQISVGTSHACAAIEQNYVTCWGENSFGKSDAPLGPAVQVSVGSSVCAINESGELRCWASGRSSSETVLPIPNDLGAVSQVEVYDDTVCAITIQGLVRCWGRTSFAGEFQDQYRIDDYPNIGFVTQITLGQGHLCAINFEQRAFCWGRNDQGGVPSDLGKVRKIASNMLQTCAITVSNQVRCWGWSPHMTSLKTPDDLGQVTEIGVGRYHVCVVTFTKELRCWGNNPRWQPLVPADLGKVVKVSSGPEHTCVIKEDNSEVCLGYDAGKWVPMYLQSPISAMSERGAMCVINAAGAVICAGINVYSQDYPFKFGTRPKLLGFQFDSEPISEPLLLEPVAVGNTITAQVGNIDSQTALTYQWLIDGKPAIGYTDSKYVLSANDEGKYISVRVTSSRYGFNAVIKESAGYLVSLGSISNSVIPTIVGSSVTGGRLTVVTGEWASGILFSYEWLRNGSVIRGEKNSSYVPVSFDYKARISVRVTGLKVGYEPLNVTSSETVIGEGALSKTSVPKIQGIAKVNQTLTVSPGIWDTGVSFTYQWFRNGNPISKATSIKYKLTTGDKGKKISVKVIGKKVGFKTVAKTSIFLTVK